MLFQQLQGQVNISALQAQVTEAGRELAHQGSSQEEEWRCSPEARVLERAQKQAKGPTL